MWFEPCGGGGSGSGSVGGGGGGGGSIPTPTAIAQHVVVVGLHTHSTHDGPSVGEFTPPTEGTLCFQWSNAASLLRAKSVRVRVKPERLLEIMVEDRVPEQTTVQAAGLGGMAASVFSGSLWK